MSGSLNSDEILIDPKLNYGFEDRIEDMFSHEEML
jgi:hypothetical protein